MAAIAHGSAAVTEDVDVCIRFDEPTLRGVFRALEGTNPRERMNKARPTLGSDPLKFVGYRNLYVTTDLGVLDLLGEISAVGGFEQVSANALALEIAGIPMKVMAIRDLITSKRSVGRPKDLRVARELELVLERLKTS
jgi:hypothetical protein